MPKRKTAPRGVCAKCGKSLRVNELEVNGEKKMLCKIDAAIAKKHQRKVSAAEKLQKEAEAKKAAAAEAPAEAPAES